MKFHTNTEITYKLCKPALKYDKSPFSISDFIILHRIRRDNVFVARENKRDISQYSINIRYLYRLEVNK